MPKLAEVQTEEVGVVTQSWPQKTLRDEFAMAVVTGLAAYPHRIGEDNKPEHFAIWSYAIADAMLAARTK